VLEPYSPLPFRPPFAPSRFAFFFCAHELSSAVFLFFSFSEFSRDSATGGEGVPHIFREELFNGPSQEVW